MRPDGVTLHRLYVDERMTTRQIAEIYGVDKVSVGRWLAKYGIPKRLKGRGLAHRGVEPPAAEVLRSLVHDQHLSYREIAKRYGVDFTAVPHWLDRHGIERPAVWTTRRGTSEEPLPGTDDLAALYAQGASLAEIGALFGVSRLPVRTRLKAANITLRADGWDGGKRLACADGHLVRSTYEQRVCDWLSERGVQHTYEPRLPWDLRSRADFLASGWYIEVWGVTNSPLYAARRQRKIDGYRAHRAPLVQINHFDFSGQKRGRWQRLLSVTASSVERLSIDR